MKKILLLLFASSFITSLPTFAQDTLIASFKSKRDTVYKSAGSSYQYIKNDTLIVPIQNNTKKYNLTIEINNEKSTISNSNVFFSSKNKFETSPDENKADTFILAMIIDRDSLHERTLPLKLDAFDESNNKVALCGSCQG